MLDSSGSDSFESILRRRRRDDDTESAADAAVDARRAPRWPRWVFRVTSTVAAVMLFDQAVFAGQFLDGTYDSLHVHRENATFAGISVLVSAVAGGSRAVAGPRTVVADPGVPRHLRSRRGCRSCSVSRERSACTCRSGSRSILLAAALAVWAWRRR